MKKLGTIKISFAILALSMICACGGKTDNSNQTDAQGGQQTEANEVNNDATNEVSAQSQSETADETTASEDAATEGSQNSEEESSGALSEKPALILHRGYKEERDNDASPKIKHFFTYYSLDAEYAKFHEGLNNALLEAEKEVVDKEKEAFDKDLKTLQEEELFTFYENWLTSIRRADGKYVSILNEYCTDGQFDDGYYTEYTAHSYYTDSGEEIAFTDVVADEDAFYDLMADKVCEYVSYAQKNIYANDVDIDKDQMKADLKDYMSDGKLAWTLDSQGVSFYINGYIALPQGFSATVLFAEDSDKTIFNKEFSEQIPDEWAIQVPWCAGGYVDVNDDGTSEYVCANEIYDLDESVPYEEYCVSALNISCDGGFKSVPTAVKGSTDFFDVFMIHKDNSTALVENHYEYDIPYVSTYKLDTQSIEAADSDKAHFRYAEDEQREYDSYMPYYIPLDGSYEIVDDGYGDSADAGSDNEVMFVTDTSNNMSDSDLRKIEKKLNSIGYYGFLISLYNDPTNIYWDDVFYVGAGFDDRAGSPSAEVKRAYLKATGDEEIYTDLTTVSGEVVKDYVKKTTGHDYSEMVYPLDWVYLKDYDLYVSQHGDTNQIVVEVVAGHCENDQYIITYDGGMNERRCVIFVDEGDTLRFIANLPEWMVLDPINGGDVDQSMITEGMIFPDSDVEKLTEADLEGLSSEELRIARNEIYARRGRIFVDKELQAHFEQMEWYSPMFTADEFDESVLNENELYNLKLIGDYEKKTGN